MSIAPTPEDSAFERALATWGDEPVSATTTPAAPAAEARDIETPAPATTPTARDEPPPAGRDEQGRFRPKVDAAPPEDAAPEEPATPEATAPPAETPAATAPPARDYERELATLRGQVTNAAQQAADKARADTLAEAQRAARTSIVATLQEMVNSGEVTFEQAQAAHQRHREQWATEDQAARERTLTQREADARMGALSGTVQEATAALWSRATPLMAQEHGLPVEDVRALWDDEAERHRFQRAILQQQMATQYPQGGFNAQAAEDYLETTSTALRRIAAVKRDTATQLAAKDREIADLRLQLNRADAEDNPATRPEAHTRGGARSRAANPDEHAERVLTDNLTTFAQAFGLHR